MMKKHLILSGILFAGAVFTLNAATPAAPAPKAAAPAVAPADPWAAIPEKLAEYDGKVYTKTELKAAIAAKLPGAQLPPEQLKMLLPMLIQQEVSAKLAELAQQKAGFAPSEKLVRTVLNRELAAMSAAQRKEVETELAKQNMTIAGYIEKMAKDPSIQRRVATMEYQQSLFGNITVSDAEVQKYFETHPQEFVQPADGKDALRASHILIAVPQNADAATKVAARKKADDILAQLRKNPAAFAAIAARESACPSKQRGGSLGAFAKGQMVPEFEKALLQLKDGEISGVVVTQYGYHIIRRDALQAEKRLTFAEVKASLKNWLLQRKRQEAVMKYMDKLLKDAKYKCLVGTK